MTSRPQRPRRARADEPGEAPWNEGNPDKKIGINVPFPEPLMLQMDYLLEHRAITSKSAFIRDAVAAAASEELRKLRRLQEAMRRIEEEDAADRP